MNLKTRLRHKYQIDQDTGCWNWTAGTNGNGYGKIWISGAHHLAHRISYQIAYGAIPLKTQVLHRCDNRRCINQSHLFLGTPAENMKDKVAKNRQNRGVDKWCAKLTEEQVRDIRAAKGYFQRDLASKYGVSRGNISQIMSGKTWRHIA